MNDRGELLRDVMLTTGTTQSELSRLSGVHQPSISQFVSGKVDLSDELLDRLLSCMGFRLEVVRRYRSRELNRSEERSWRLHRSLSSRLTPQLLEVWLPTIEENLRRLRQGTTGQPHEQNTERWSDMLSRRDTISLKRVLTGLDRDSIEMREVSPLGGLLTDQERREILQLAS